MTNIVIPKNSRWVVYIGQTKHTAHHRFSKHKSACRAFIRDGSPPKGTCVKLYRAMEAHEIDSFTIETIIESESKTDRDMLEEFYIILYDSVKNGYNQKSGGDASEHSEDTKQQISKSISIHRAANTDYNRRSESIGLPQRVIYISDPKNRGFAINKHPLCSRKTFTINRYGSFDLAKQAAIDYLDLLNSGNPPAQVPKVEELPKGINKITNGYEVRKIHNNILYNRSFTDKQLKVAVKKQLAIDYLNNLIISWQQDESIQENVQRLSVSRSELSEQLEEIIDDLDLDSPYVPDPIHA
jgi:hypothetical protein